MLVAPNLFKRTLRRICRNVCSDQVICYSPVHLSLHSLGPQLYETHLTTDLPSMYQLALKISPKHIFPSCNIQQSTQDFCSLIPCDVSLVWKSTLRISGQIHCMCHWMTPGPVLQQGRPLCPILYHHHWL